MTAKTCCNCRYEIIDCSDEPCFSCEQLFYSTPTKWEEQKGTMTGSEIIKLLQTIYTYFDYSEGYELFHVENWGDKSEWDKLWERFNNNFYNFLCHLDAKNVDLLFEWAKKTDEKMMSRAIDKLIKES